MIWIFLYILGYVLTSAGAAFFDDPTDDALYFLCCVLWPIIWLFWFVAIITMGPFWLVRSWLEKPVEPSTIEIGEEIIAVPIGSLIEQTGIYLGNNKMGTIYTQCKIDPKTIRIKNKKKLTKLGKLLYKKK